MAKLKNLIRGDAFSLTIPVRNADGTPFDFTGYKVFLTVKASVDDDGEMTSTTQTLYCKLRCLACQTPQPAT